MGVFTLKKKLRNGDTVHTKLNNFNSNEAKAKICAPLPPCLCQVLALLSSILFDHHQNCTLTPGGSLSASHGILSSLSSGSVEADSLFTITSGRASRVSRSGGKCPLSHRVLTVRAQHGPEIWAQTWPGPKSLSDFLARARYMFFCFFT